MNKNVFNTSARELSFTGFGQDISDNVIMPFRTDSLGRLILSNNITIDAVSNNLDIRALTDSDSATITVPNLSIRPLNGNIDGVEEADTASAVDYDRGTIGILTTTYFLPADISPYSDYSYLVKNTSGLSVGVDITLQAAPANVNNYYVDDGSSFSLLGGNVLVLQPTAILKFARVKITSLLSIASVEVYLFGRV